LKHLFLILQANHSEMEKPALNQFSILETFRQRWSPRAFSDKPVETEKLQSIFEAARWAPSSMNEQPWRFIVGIKGDDSWQRIYDTLVEWNQQWAGNAPVLILNLGKRTFTYKGRPNATYHYDTGQAVAMMITEAQNLGLYTHQMGGFSREKAVELLHIPEDFHPLSVTALGYYGDASMLPEDMQESELAARKRRPLREMVYAGQFGEPSALF
jgi:nitroreductase